MADIVQTPANVAAGANAFPVTIRAVAGAAIVAGQPVAYNPTALTWSPATAGGSATQSGQYGSGIALDSAPGSGQWFTVQLGGQVNLGATLVVGTAYVVSVNSGAIAPYTDLVSGNYVTILGVAISTSLMVLPSGGPLASGVQM